MSLILNPHRFASVASGYLLDDYPSAETAFSVDLLTTDYSGALVKLRRDSDNAEKDFYPDTSDTLSMTSEDGAGTSLSTWVGANSAFVVTWYDQSGSGTNHDVTQATTTLQPQLVSSGSLLTVNGKAAIVFDGTDDYLQYSGAITLGDDLSTFTVLKKTTTPGGDNMVVYGYGSAGKNAHMGYRNGGYMVRQDGSNGTGYDFSGTPQHVVSVIHDHVGLANTIRVNQNVGSDSNLGWSSNFDGITLGDRSILDKPCNMEVQELVFYIADKASDQTGIEGNINGRFDIYFETGLLDTYTGAGAAYGLLQLRAAQTNCIRIRRSSDNSEQDIGFDYKGDLDTDAIDTFCSGTDGFVVTWYDQSGNGRDITETTTSQQGKIATSGSTLTYGTNSRPSMTNNAGAAYGYSVAYTTPTQPFSMAFVGATDATAAAAIVWDNNTSIRMSFTGGGTPQLRFGGTVLSATGAEDGSHSQIVAVVDNSGTSSIKLNNNSTATGSTVGTGSGSSISFPGNNNGTSSIAQAQLCIVWEGDKTSDLSSIMTELNDYFGAY